MNWDVYENRYRESCTTPGGILHQLSSQNILTADADEIPPVGGDITSSCRSCRPAKDKTA